MSEMERLRDIVRSASVSIIVVGFFMLFFSFAFIVVFPENEHSAFPYPLGVPGLVAIIVGISMYLLSKSFGTENKGQGQRPS